MASANFLEEALKSDVDESAVNAIVGTLENQLDVNTNLVQQVGSVGKPDAGDSAIAEVPNGATATPQQKPDLGGGLANGEIAVSNNNTITANNNAPAKPTIVTSANSPSTATVVARPSVALPKSGVPQQQQQRSNSVVIAGGGATRGGGNINIISQQIVVPPPPFNVPSSSQKQTLTTAGNSIVLSNHQLHQPSSNMPKNEPVKLVYPAGAQQTAAVLNMNNNRVTLTPSGLSNGTITMSQQPQLIQTANLVGKTTTTSSALQQQQQAGGGGVSGQPTPTLIIKNQQTNTVMNSGAPGIVTVSKPMNNQITLSALQGQQGSTLLLKNEQGQFQLLRIGPAPTGTQITPASLTPSSTNQTIRLQTVPATHASGTGTIIVSSQSGTTPQTSYISTQPTPVASVAPVPALAAQQNITITHTSASPATVLSTQQSQQQQQHGSTGSVAGQQTSQQQQQQPTVVVTTTPAVTQQRNSLDNTKEKCSKFLTNLIELSKREPTKVEQNVRTLIQELVDANVDPAEFCERLERLLNASPQPCLIGFLKKSLPLLRQSLVTKEITIEGINPPSAAVAFAGTALSSIPAQIRPVAPTIVSQGSMIGQTQIRMLTNQSGVTTLPRIGQTTIRPAAPIRIQTPLQQQSTVTAGGTTIVGQPRTSTLTTQQIRPNVTTIGHTTIVQTAGQQLPQTISTTPPALLPIRTPSGTSITRSGTTLQIRTTTPITSRTLTSIGGTTVTTTGKQILQSQSVNQIRGQTPVASVAAVAAAAAAAASGSSATQVKQVTAITGGGNVVVSLNQNPPPMQPVSALGGAAGSQGGTQAMPALTLTSAASAAGFGVSGGVVSGVKSATAASATIVLNSSSTVSSTAASASIGSGTAGATASGTALATPGLTTIKTITAKSQNLSGAAAASAKKKASASAASSAGADQDASKRAGASAQSQFYHHHAAMYGEDDINDVAAMGGVNLAEETQRILGSTEFVGTQIRSCKDEVFLHLPALQSRIRNIIARHGLEEPSNEVAVLISHACQERLKNVVEKLAIIAEHRIDIIKVDPRYEVTKDVRGQIKFLEELDKAEQKRHEEQEREMLMRAAKSRSKTEDPEQAKLKAKAKEMQRAEMEELRQRDANLTALQAIGPRKKPKLEEGSSTSATPGASGIGSLSGKAPTPLRPRIKRVNLRDMLFYMEQERESCRSQMLYKAYLK
ncbi:transcription initiation factor TFIID subunit 4-like isoform X2 [Anopheles aquasalis]|uniref:transcription initiation factor TFIID subunit 4-like isoform X2 n=1 Tax=Anopheles aquasalis TaxID=42839 RepID=UPI00215A83D3|nr:transcription initiation factor TFIID subunit 4-like isoform X2 [Anopheles aquasalis]